MSDAILVWTLVLVSTSAWGNVFVHWTSSAMPPEKDFGLNTLVLSCNDGFWSRLKAAHRQGYKVYVEVSLGEAATLAETCASGVEGVILTVRQSERAEVEKSVPRLRVAHPKLKFLVLDSDAKQPQMRGSLVIKRGSVLEVSSPTAQPWIDSNLSLVRIEKRFHPEQVPLYTFNWEGPSGPGQQRSSISAPDYLLAVAEAGAFHADLLLDLDESLQRALCEHDPAAWKLWNQVRAYEDFYAQAGGQDLKADANVAVVVDDLDPSDEAMNLLARHNIPFEVFLPADLKQENLEGFDAVVVFAKPDREACERLADLAIRGKNIVLVDAHSSCQWQSRDSVRLNKHVTSYALGSGKVLEVSEPISDPEMFAQDIRRLLGKEHALMTLFNGLTTIAVPYRERARTVKVLEFVNYAGSPLRVQVQIKGSFSSIRYETPEHKCCEALVPVVHNEFTEFVIPELEIAGRVRLEANPVK